MDLYLKIDQDENFQFFEKYDTLSPLRKKIWAKIVQIARKWVIAQPSQSKIALWCECSRSAVSEAFKLFREWGWLALVSRGFKKSKTLLIPHSKRQLDVVNRQYFKRVEATYGATHTYSMFRKQTSNPTGCLKPLEISTWLQKTTLSLDAKLKLSLFSEHTYQETLYSCKLQASKGNVFANPEQYFIGAAVKKAKQKGEKVDWKRYYRAIA